MMNLNTLIKQAYSLGYKGITLEKVCELTPVQLVELSNFIDSAMKVRAQQDAKLAEMMLKFKDEGRE
jgi:hypothetical protein